LEFSPPQAARVQAPENTAELQSVDWETIPQDIRRSLGNIEADFTFSSRQTPFTLPVQIIRHETAELLPAQVESATLHTILTDTDMMLTQATLQIDPGDKRHLRVTLPNGGTFWFATVNSVSARPWKEGNDLLIPLEKPLESNQASVLSFTYSTSGQGNRLPNDFRLIGPSFDLPLKDIRWTIDLPDGRIVKEVDEAWRLDRILKERPTESLPIETYLQSHVSAQKEKTKKAESLLNFGNSLLQKGDQQRARQAFNSAYNLSQHDDAFNEDARVQLQNLKRTQALVGLVGRRGNAFADQQGAQAERNVQLKFQTDLNGPRYSERDVKRALADNDADVNRALVQLAEQLIEQQDATVTTPEGLHAQLPTHKNQHVFTRSIMVDKAALSISLETRTETTANTGQRFSLMILLAALFTILSLISRAGKPESDKT